MLPMNLQRPENTGVEPRDRLGKKITPYDLEGHRVDVGGKIIETSINSRFFLFFSKTS